MTRSSGLNTSVGARIARGCGVVLVGALWLGVTTTTVADGASARPGDAPSPAFAPETMAQDAPARALPRLVASSATLTGPAGQKLHAALRAAQDQLGAQPPAGDAAVDAAALESALAAGAAADPKRAAEAAARETAALAGRLAESALTAPPAQALRLLDAAGRLSDSARATLVAAGVKNPAIDGDVASVMARVGGAAGATTAPDAAATQNTKTTNRLVPGTGTERADALGASLAPSFAGALCTGENATTIQGESTAEAAPVESFTPLAGFPTFSAESTSLHDDRADLLHEAGAAAGRLAYASEVVAARANTAQSIQLASQRGELARALQAAQPDGCAPVVVTSAGEPNAFIGKDASATMKAARGALADRLLRVAAATGGDARESLLSLWWAQRP